MNEEINKRMKIEETLASAGLPFTKKLKVGAVDGSAFFYCGTVGDFRIHIDDYSALALKSAQTSVSEAKKRLETRISNPPDIARFIRSELKKPKHDFSLRNYTAYCEWYLKSIERMTAALENAQDLLGKFKSFESRDVVELREADPAADPGVTVLIIDGYERGGYWTLDEAAGRHYISFGGDYGEQEDDEG